MSGPQLGNLEQWDTSNSGSGWPRTLSIACLAPVWVPKWTFTATGFWEQAFLQNQRALHSLSWAGLRGHCWSPVLLVKAHPDSGRGNVMERVSKNSQSLKTHGSSSSRTSPANSGGCTSFLKTLKDYFQWKCLLHCVVYMVCCILFFFFRIKVIFYCTFTTHIFIHLKIQNTPVSQKTPSQHPLHSVYLRHTYSFEGRNTSLWVGLLNCRVGIGLTFPVRLGNCQFLT